MPAAVDDYLREWEDRRERGEAVTAADLCPDWAEGRAELVRLIGLLEQCDRLLDVEEPPPAPPGEAAVPAAVAGYEVRGELGRGGMGVVYRAWDPVLHREVALKTLHRAGLAGLPDEAARLSRRFQQEAQVLAQLKHEHIVPVHEARVDDGRPYFVMECVPGGSLATRLREMTAAGPGVIAPFVEKVARAVHHAHGHGVLHRDLKPANILLEWGSEGAKVPVPKVSDFGLAKLMSAEADTLESPAAGPRPSGTGVSRLTAPGFQPGTPAYMAPEQFDPSFGKIGPATDVWALGVILYELLTGRKPFVGATWEALREHVCHGAPARPRSLRRPLDRGLEAIVLRCLEKDPGRRFPSARELADRLARRRRVVRRRRWAVGLLLGLAVVGAGAWWGVRESSPERRYERRVAPLLARLQRGEAVDLVQPGGEAPAFRVRCGEGSINARMAPEGFVVTAPGYGIVEFLPRVPVPRYRIHAELRHDRSWGVGNTGVGVTFTGRHVPSPEGRQHLVAAVILHDWGRTPGKEERQRRAMLQLIWWLDTPTNGRSPFEHEMCLPNDDTAYYSRPAHQERDPHTLDIHVEPEGTTAVLGAAPGQTMGPLRPDLFSWFSKHLREKHEELRGVDLESLNRPAIGVLVSAGQCTIQRLQIVPQSDAPP